MNESKTILKAEIIGLGDRLWWLEEANNVSQERQGLKAGRIKSVRFGQSMDS